MSKREALQRIGDRVTLPTLPEVVMRINRMADDPSVGVKDIGAVVAQDPSLSASVLKIANSAFYGLSQPVVSAEEAANVIGAAALKNIAMQASIMKRYERFSNLPDFDLGELWEHSQSTAVLARALAQLVPGVAKITPEDFYTCGLLHDVGKVLLIEGMGEEYLEVIRKARMTGKALHVAEQEMLGFTHVGVGALLAQRWDLPDTVATAIEFHHGPREAILGISSVAVVSIADQIAYRAESRTFESSAQRLTALAGKVLGVQPEPFRKVLDLARDHTETAGAW